MAYWGHFAPYVPVAEKKAKAARKLKQLQKKNPNIRPVIIEGRTIAGTWWGKSWCLNLERYADYANRIGRGRSYVRHGAVLDLQITPCRIKALVQGSRSKPYEVEIQIKKLKAQTWRQIRTHCAGHIDSLQELLAGQFPKALGEIFLAQGDGLFPSPKEIQLNCSCPDWAEMCKHVAAVLYGVGARLDESPELLFLLRDVAVDELIGQAVKKSADKLRQQAEANPQGAEVIADTDLSALFGIDLDTPVPKSRKPKKAPAGTKVAKKTPAKRSPAKKAAAPKAAAKKPSPKKKAAVTKANKPTEAEQIIRMIRRSRKGIDTAALQQRTGLSPVKIRNTIYAALRKGVIQRVERGIYKGDNGG